MPNSEPCDDVKHLTAEAATVLYDAYDLLDDVEDLKDKAEDLSDEAISDYAACVTFFLGLCEDSAQEAKEAAYDVIEFLISADVYVKSAGAEATDAFGELYDEMCECYAVKGSGYRLDAEYEGPLEDAKEDLELAKSYYDEAKAMYPHAEDMVSELLDLIEDGEEQNQDDVVLLA